MPGTQLRFNCCYWATWRRVFKCLVNCWHLLTWVTILVENCERFNSIPALIIVFSFSDTEKRVLEHPSCILLLCHKSVKETSQHDHSCSGCQTLNTRLFECWDQSPFTSWAAPVVGRVPVWVPTCPAHTQTRLPHRSIHGAGTEKHLSWHFQGGAWTRAHGLLSPHSPSPHKSWSFLLSSLRLLLCLPVSIHPLALCYAKVGRSQPLLPSSHSELNLHQL